ncbi:MAG: DUF4296 domain-containing protein [Bacteroidota bacterium]
MKFFTYIFVLVFLLSCESKTNLEKPKDLIPEDQMVDLLVDINLANAAKSVKNKNAQKKINYMPLVYEKYNIDSTRFANSNLYYTSKVDEYRRIFQEVDERLEDLRANQLSIQDSIATVTGDSLMKYRRPPRIK